MKSRTTVLTLLIVTVAVTSIGCRSPYHSDRLALFGGLSGAGLGASIGQASGKSAEGALLGAALGSLTGAVVGDHMDEMEARNQALIQERLGRRLAGAVRMEDVIAMSQAGLSDDVIRTHIAAHGVARPPTAQDLIILKQQGVSNAAINAMQTPPPRPAPAPAAPRPVVVEEHYYVPPPYPWHRYHRHRHRRPGVSWGVSFSN